jgi:hypothetical protein
MKLWMEDFQISLRPPGAAALVPGLVSHVAGFGRAWQKKAHLTSRIR